MAAGYETAVDTRGDSTILKDSMGAMISKVLAAKVMANKEREYAKKQAWKQGIDEAQFDAMNPPGFFFKKALVGEFGGFAVKKKKQELAALYRKGLLFSKITKNKRLRGKVLGQLKESLIYSKANLKNAKRFRSQFDYNDYDEIFAPQNKKIPSTRKKVKNALGGGKGKRISREQIIESIDAIAKSIEKTAQSITQSSSSVYGTLITANQLQADVAKDLKIRNSTLEDKLQKLVDVISNQTQIHQDFIDKKEDIQQESQLERKTVAATSEIPDDLKTIVNESRTYSTFANEQAMMDPYLRQPPEVKPVNSMVNDTASMEAYGFPKAERGGKFTGNGLLELHGTEALASDSGVKIVSGPDSGYIHKIDEPTSIIPLDNNFTQGERSAVDGKVRPAPKTPMINNIQKFEMGTKNNFSTSNSNVKQYEMGTNNQYKLSTFNINTDASQPLVDAMSLPMMAAGGGILASTTNYINSLGASGDEIKPELSKVTRSVAKVYGLPSTIATKASGTKSIKKLDDKKKNKKEEDTGGKKNLFEKMKEGFGKFMELLGKKINDADPSDPNGTGGPGASGNLLPGDAPAEIKALMSTISGGEGGPNSVQGIGAVQGLENMTIDDAIAKAKSYIGKGSSTGALGAFQFHSSYLRERAIQAGLDPSKAKFSMENQTQIMRNFMTQVYTAGGGKGGEAGMLKALQEGKLESEIFPKLSKDLGWPSLPGGSQQNVHSPGAAKRYREILARYQQQSPRSQTPVAGNPNKSNNPPGALAAGQRPDLALSDPQYKAQQKAIKEADAMGLTGKERAKYIADKVMAVPSPIFDRPSKQVQAETIQQISTNPRQNIKPQIIALNTDRNTTSTAGAASPPSLGDSTIPSGRNPLKDSGIYIG